MKIEKPLEELTNTRLTIVGGILEGNGALSDNDACYLRLATTVLGNLGVPLHDAYGQYLDFANVADPVHVDAMNLNGRGHGGKRDFLKDTIQTDILMMANVAYRQSEGGDYLDGLKEGGLDLHNVFRLKNSMDVSPENAKEDVWKKQINASGARIVVVVGSDDFPPAKIAGDEYIMLKNAVVGMAGILVRRDYLQDLRPHLKKAGSPLFSVAVAAQANPANVDFVRDENSLKFYPVKSPERLARMAREAANIPSPWTQATP